MNNQQLLEIIKRLPLKNYEDHGAIVAATDIYDACSTRGFNNTDIIKAKLEILEQERAFRVVRGFDDIIIGVKGYH
ncbi:hypothetical protein A8L34_22455 [Bacillus sp. FJAT-27264]|uniref:hypothetical protein n=1 Tax=Paenibacillus sp. (strain DSM 101736 / FJAT-27264) TaxID=1850362 RepID=UPI000807A8AF|nr:hypothetical protein [Bacillus sp. FJAT-27264]OBZ08918.1 hypothetical protein A8L34_22455 [Bacillus sp. FJAT-27264]